MKITFLSISIFISYLSRILCHVSVVYLVLALSVRAYAGATVSNMNTAGYAFEFSADQTGAVMKTSSTK